MPPPATSDDLLRSAVDPTIAVDPKEVARVVEEIFPEALGVWIYGSFADGSARADSDLDIAVLPDRPLKMDWDDLGRFGDLTLRLGRDVDLVDLRRVPPLLRFEIFSSGVRIAARDPAACDFFETAAISGYQRLNVERRDLLDAIAARGTVY
jgi:predicted nucleotidyltransferase